MNEKGLDQARDDSIRIRDPENSLENGQIKCPQCGATDIQMNPKTGHLRCNFCRHEFDVDLAEEDADISSLEGTSAGSGASDISEDADNMMTLKCQSCGAEVVIDTASSVQARCHWCRNTLSLNQQIPNGAVPDVLLPFQVQKQDAKEEIENFVQKRKFFAHPTFTKEFTTDNICGVYFPYMLVDVNGHMKLSGKGEIETRSRTIKKDDKEYTVYDADLYQVDREFDIFIDDLSIEASSDKLDYSAKDKTTNIINAIMPFDTENCVKFNANYLKGYTSEKRDTNIGLLKKATDAQSSDVARLAAKETLTAYDRGVKWEEEDFTVKGDSWKAAYLPVWLYSYMEKKDSKNLLHYVAVNARSQETMGSVPINFTKLFFCAVLVEIVSLIGALILNLVAGWDTFNGTSFQEYRNAYWLLLVSGPVFYYTIYMRYRNSDARHVYELETKHEMSNLVKEDKFIKSEYGLREETIIGENSSELKGNRLDFSQDAVLNKALKKGIDLNEAIKNKDRLDRMDKDQ